MLPDKDFYGDADPIRGIKSKGLFHMVITQHTNPGFEFAGTIRISEQFKSPFSQSVLWRE
jgi:hypothetical protein